MTETTSTTAVAALQGMEALYVYVTVLASAGQHSAFYVRPDKLHYNCCRSA
jgi:hypothetical protein